MKTIHKFRLECGKAANRLKLRQGARVVRCEYVVPEKGVFLWVEQPLNPAAPIVQRQFVVTASGDPVPSRYQYLDTALDPFGPEAYHLFEVPLTVEDSQGSSQQCLVPPLSGNAGFQSVGSV